VGRHLNAVLSVNAAYVNSTERPIRLRERVWSRWGLAIVVLGLGLCVAGCLFVSGWATVLGRPAGAPLRLGTGPMDICAGAVVQPRFQVGVGWQSPIMSRTPPLVVMSPYAACLSTPMWPVGFPARGEWMFPP